MYELNESEFLIFLIKYFLLNKSKLWLDDDCFGNQIAFETLVSQVLADS